MKSAAENARFPWPPVIYLAAFAIAVELWVLYPLPWFGAPFSDILFAVGCIAVLATVGLYVSAIRTLHRGQTTIRPDRASAHLVTGGAFSITRNPIYLANTVFLMGIGLISGIAWFLPMALLAALLAQKLAIEGEERHLAARFGKRYADYTRRVRRWL